MMVRNIETGEEREITRGVFPGARNYHWSISPDGEQLAILFKEENPSIKIFSTRTDDVKEVLAGDFVNKVHQIVWAPDGKGLILRKVDLSVSQTSEIWRIETSGGVPEKLSELDLPEYVIKMQVDPTGRQLALEAITNLHELWVMEDFLPAAAVAKPTMQQPTQRRIEVLTHSPRRIHSSPSLDGKYMASTDRTGKLVVSESATGKKWNLSEQGGVSGLGILPLISPDNTRIVYSWISFKEETWEARIVALDGSNDRLLLPAEKIPGWLYIDTWSPDGQFLFCRHARPDKDNSSRLVRVSVDDGSMQYIDAVDANGLSKVDISSDGRFLAYHRQDKTTSKSDIFIFDLLENRESVFVRNPADDKLLGWTPDGQKIFFTSDRMGTTDGWLLAVQQGQPKGLPTMIKPGIGDVNPIRLTRDGSLYYSVQYEGWNVYTVELDLAAGKVLSEPKAVRDMGKDSSPDWSPDGRYLAYRSQPDPDRPRVIRIRILETGEERELKPDLPHAEYIRWHPDSRHILVPYLKSAGLAGVSQIDIQTGQCRDLMTASVVEGELIRQAELSADGKMLAYRVKDGGHGNRLVARDMETGLEKVLLSMDDLVRAGMPGGNSWTLMPDGEHVALSILDGTYQLKVMSVADKTSRTIVSSFFGQLTCANDGRDLLFVRGKGDKELWRVATTGSEPRKVWEFEQLIGDPRLHPDGRHLAFVSGTFISEMWVMENFLPAAAVAGSGK